MRRETAGPPGSTSGSASCRPASSMTVARSSYGSGCPWRTYGQHPQTPRAVRAEPAVRATRRGARWHRPAYRHQAGFRARLFADDPPLPARRVAPPVRRAVLAPFDRAALAPFARAALAPFDAACFVVPPEVDAARDAFCPPSPVTR